MSAAQAADLLSWPAAAFAVTYGAWTFRRWLHRQEHTAHAFTALMLALLGLGFLLRPLDSIGVLEDAGRDTAALALRVVFLIVAAGLTWNLFDTWRERRAARKGRG